MSTDIAQRLRIGIEAGAIDLADIMDAADEIERLRLTEEELAAVDTALHLFSGVEDVSAGASGRADAAAATLRTMLAKHAPQPAENRP